MSDIRKLTTEEIDHPEVRKHMEKFWEAYDKLFVDMDNLPYEEFEERHKEMWSHRNNAMDVRGDMFLISLWGMSNKAHTLYGDKCKPTI
jgi:hypothetical protein